LIASVLQLRCSPARCLICHGANGTRRQMVQKRAGLAQTISFLFVGCTLHCTYDVTYTAILTYTNVIVCLFVCLGILIDNCLHDYSTLLLPKRGCQHLLKNKHRKTIQKSQFLNLKFLNRPAECKCGGCAIGASGFSIRIRSRITSFTPRQLSSDSGSIQRA